MDVGSFPTRFDRCGRWPALALLGLLGAVLIFVAWPVDSTPKPRVRASQTEQSDLDLYRDTIAGVRAGGPYYAVAADELRKGGYPLKPFFTFRLPTLVIIYAQFPALVMLIGQGMLALAVMFAWWRRLEPVLPLRMRALALVLLVGGTAALVEPVTGMFHESWAALLMALMVALRRPGQAAAAIVAGAAALMIRETALPMILVMAGLALIERRQREALAWAGVVLLFVVVMFVHAQMVASVVRPEDLSSPGWSGMLGPRFALGAMAMVSSVIVLPKALAAVILILSLFGWFSLASPWALRASLLILGYGTMLALFSRADTFYWALLVAPLSLLGLIFVPRSLGVLVRAARGVAEPSQ